MTLRQVSIKRELEVVDLRANRRMRGIAKLKPN